jgi:hypothetical protein
MKIISHLNHANTNRKTRVLSMSEHLHRVRHTVSTYIVSREECRKGIITKGILNKGMCSTRCRSHMQSAFSPEQMAEDPKSRVCRGVSRAVIMRRRCGEAGNFMTKICGFKKGSLASR